MQSVLVIDQNNNVLQQYNIEDWQTQEITLDWNRSKNWNTFTFEDWYYWTDIFYVDWYWKDQQLKTYTDLYLNWNLTIWYTWEQYLTLTDEKCWVFNWYTPVFDVTGTTQYISETWNVFNNFSDNALKVLLSNIPSYIQYITIFFILLFLFWFIRRFKRKR